VKKCADVFVCRLGRSSVWERLSRDTVDTADTVSVETDLRQRLDRKRRRL